MEELNLPKKYQKMLGKVFPTKVALKDECDQELPAGTLLRVVAVAPKVMIAHPLYRKNHPDLFDASPWFYNAVRADQISDSGNRIRANFVTLGKEVKRGS